MACLLLRTKLSVLQMLKKIVKYTLRTLLVVLLLVLLIPALLYIPAVQDFIRGKAVGYASEALGMELSVGRIRLAFPLRLTVEETLLVDRADTLVDCGKLSVDIALWPLIRKEVVVRSFELDGSRPTTGTPREVWICASPPDNWRSKSPGPTCGPRSAGIAGSRFPTATSSST